ncbi:MULTISPECIES: DUF423 domain-containing protein [Flavobacterium]|jgi:uncharacterized membrane protein YgdD (TMEM256/DUF423 family)|uniref:DUF423 domain-containing protein n=1 Tax=Flavobacterium johnsoniae (strain ATCC 17061 / DSM 2064 / JCM 8514 / BCRC 14874 / CCUG 350202 / NBRC 14942 / NCIMB 11054 / UW101) TaxID=376686 RepID=A5FK67_FLAJ1|nr:MULTISPECIES: DUF423 domain-containing protein [Flavobacterium]ABQ04397.1 protein of unknown function DUF423 [Flavobacterium johnsoniae UW101]OXE97722.1 DUF423 domain-containing protein [Flavobacterium johnsoniae UW101]WDF60115.1 DUF423 domain-containing protein [Flavobacterium sp. KACC 22758]WQG83809.1 DUF423 domain-containing protein [Flavobacterium johnsoniae UW101]SHK21325.1 Uncharacterized membrane protein YgdD, TMEM256/DUF423 family [Flavobacterium johnsoniae]
MKRKIVLTGAFIGMLAIIFGAFGAHLLKKYLSIEELNTFEVGVRYQMYHALFLLFLSTRKDIAEKTVKTIYNLVVAGVVLFSGSIYILATKSLTVFDSKIIVFATPLGGFLLIIGWAVLFLTILRKKS